MASSSTSWSPTRWALSIAAVYAVVSGIWIALSDEWVARVFTDPRDLTLAQTLKGWFFVLASSVLIFVLVRHAVRKARAHRRVDEYLRKVLDTFPGSVFWLDRNLRVVGCNAVFARKAGVDEPAAVRGRLPDELPSTTPSVRKVDEEEAREALADIHGAALGASGVVETLLAFGRRRELSPEPTDMGALVRGLAPMFSRLLTTTYRFQVSVEPGLPPALADPVSVEQALLNLLTNARDAMDEGGDIDLEVVLQEVDGPLQSAEGRVLSDRPLEAGWYVVLSVTDSGAGMEPRVLASALDPFFTTKPPGKGSGLGLSMVDDLVREHGGALHVESKPGHGTTVRLLFPVADADADTGARDGG